FDDIRQLLMSRNVWLDGWEELLEILRIHLRELAEAIDEGQNDEPGDASEPRDRRDRAYPTVALCSPDRELFLEQRAEWERIVIPYIGWKIDNRIVEEDDPLVDFYFKLVKFANILSEEGDEFSHLIERTPEGLKLKIFCKDPSRFLGRIFESAHATVALSATLEPFEFYRRTLGFPGDRVTELSLPSPFPRENRN